MQINDMFYSIQGEGIYSGLPMVFIRLQGCNLHCNWCDTEYAQDAKENKCIEIKDIISYVQKTIPAGGFVCITGGEPLYQSVDLEFLVRELFEKGYKIEIETNGSFKKPSWWRIVDSWCVDIKCPSSGENTSFRKEWLNIRTKDQIKFVVGSKEDLTFVADFSDRLSKINPVVFVSPVLDSPINFKWVEKVVEFCKEYKLLFSLQLHKVIWGDRKGV